MTEQNASRVATALMAAGTIAATYYVLKTPPLRRLAWRLAATAMTGVFPAWIGREVQHAWMESGRQRI